MKKLLFSLLAVLFVFTIAGCVDETTTVPATQAPPTTVAPTTTAAPTTAPTTVVTTVAERVYPVDGEFLAYQVGVSQNAPMVTYVIVTIEDDEITGYYIDCRQGTRTQTAGTDTPEDTSDDTYSFTWKTQTKKELGDDYGMATEPEQLEWYEQAALIEAYWLANGYDSVTVDESNYIDNVAGVTIKDGGYTTLAAAAVALAEEGVFQSVLCSADDLYSASMSVSEAGVVSDLLIDVLQGTPTGATFAWNTETKQELGDDYGMAGVGPKYAFSEGAWAVVPEQKCALEWYEQVALITDYVLENGWNEDLAALANRGGTIDGTTLVDDLAGVTVSSQNYYDLLSDLFGYVPEGTIE